MTLVYTYILEGKLLIQIFVIYIITTLGWFVK